MNGKYKITYSDDRSRVFIRWKRDYGWVNIAFGIAIICWVSYMWVFGSPIPWILVLPFIIFLIIALFLIYDGAVKKTNTNQLLVSSEFVEFSSKQLVTLFPDTKFKQMI